MTDNKRLMHYVCAVALGCCMLAWQVEGATKRPDTRAELYNAIESGGKKSKDISTLADTDLQDILKKYRAFAKTPANVKTANQWLKSKFGKNYDQLEEELIKKHKEIATKLATGQQGEKTQSPPPQNEDESAAVRAQEELEAQLQALKLELAALQAGKDTTSQQIANLNQQLQNAIAAANTASEKAAAAAESIAKSEKISQGLASLNAISERISKATESEKGKLQGQIIALLTQMNRVAKGEEVDFDSGAIKSIREAVDKELGPDLGLAAQQALTEAETEESTVNQISVSLTTACNADIEVLKNLTDTAPSEDFDPSQAHSSKAIATAQQNVQSIENSLKNIEGKIKSNGQAAKAQTKITEIRARLTGLKPILNSSGSDFVKLLTTAHRVKREWLAHPLKAIKDNASNYAVPQTLNDFSEPLKKLSDYIKALRDVVVDLTEIEKLSKQKPTNEDEVLNNKSQRTSYESALSGSPLLSQADKDFLAKEMNKYPLQAAPATVKPQGAPPPPPDKPGGGSTNPVAQELAKALGTLPAGITGVVTSDSPQTAVFSQMLTDLKGTYNEDNTVSKALKSYLLQIKDKMPQSDQQALMEIMGEYLP